MFFSNCFTKMLLDSKRGKLLLFGLLFHLVYLWSIFDIYFVSPLVHGMHPIISNKIPHAKRLFLIVGDGQRADKTFGSQIDPETGESVYLAPFLRSIVLNNGTYGLSHTRMPTESRPGHVAMIAGFYEDVSAVTKGWKENPVDFDSVFNRSTHTYSFGSPDILPMFAHGAPKGKIDTWMYGHEFEDFTQSSIDLDKFVFDNLYSLFDNSTSDASLNSQIRQDGNVFFLHLLGTDTSGHGYRPYSSEYYDNIRYTDSEIEKLVPKVHEFFGDEDSVFIFTADHGMSDFGSHGDGHPNNTRTPLICWGKGCNKPKEINSNPFLLDPFEKHDMSNWEFDHIQRNDVNQADIAPLMSYLIGLEYPVNSVGELPLAFIDHPMESKVKGLYLNSLALLQQYIVKEDEVKSHEFNFKPFNKFQEKSITQFQNDILKSIENNDNPVEKIEEFSEAILQGLDYLQKYNWLMLRTIVTLGFIGWIIYSFILFLQLFVLPSDKQQENSSIFIHLIASPICLAISALFYYQDSPLNYYLYLIFPTFFWGEIFALRGDLFSGFKLFFNGLSNFSIFTLFLFIIGFFESIAIGFTNRQIFSIMFIILAFYPFILFKFQSNLLISTSWFFNCLLLSIFPIQDPVKTESFNLVVSSGLLMVMIGFIGYSMLKPFMSKITSSIISLQITFILISIYSLSKSIISLSNRNGLPRDAQIINWSMLILSLILPSILHIKFLNRDYRVRFLITFLTLSPTFLILTISFESMFYILFSSLIFQWILIEDFNISKNQYVKLIRVTLIGFFNLQISFFGTGNVSSISSFSLDSVYRLLPIFDPFPMGALLMIKLIIPYILLSVGLGLLNLKLGLKKYSVTTLVICICDLLSLWFFYQVKTEGSWLMIGVSISNYILAIFGSLFIGIVEVGSGVVLNGVEIEGKSHDLKNALEKLKFDDKECKEIEKMIKEESMDDSGIASRVRKRNPRPTIIN